MSEQDIKQEVREFYDAVGWSQVGEGLYQNARYEDLRPVAREYIHNCHLRVLRHLPARGQYLLDAGCGPIQYPEYLEYSKGYQKRVCADISITALKEARARIGDHGLFVVADIAHLPFKAEAFDGLVTLHTIHHLPPQDHVPAYLGLHRVLAAGGRGVVVNGWGQPLLGRILEAPIRVRKWLRARKRQQQGEDLPRRLAENTGTHIEKYNAGWLLRKLRPHMDVEIRVWRSVSVAVLRLYIHAHLGGRALLKGLYWLEERLPALLGRIGQYPLLVIKK